VQKMAHIMLPTKQEMGKRKKPNIKQTCHVILPLKKLWSLDKTHWSPLRYLICHLDFWAGQKLISSFALYLCVHYLVIYVYELESFFAKIKTFPSFVDKDSSSKHL